MFLSSVLKEEQCCLACSDLRVLWACHCLWWIVLFHPPSSANFLLFFFLRIKVYDHKKLFCSYPLTAGLGVICFHVKILICFCKIRPSLAMQIKRVSVFRQGKLCRKAFQTEQIIFRDSPAIRAYNLVLPWALLIRFQKRFQCKDICSGKLSEKLVGNDGNLLSCPLSAAAIQPFSHLHCQHTARGCFSSLCSLKVPPEMMMHQHLSRKDKLVAQAAAECR